MFFTQAFFITCLYKLYISKIEFQSDKNHTTSRNRNHLMKFKCEKDLIVIIRTIWATLFFFVSFVHQLIHYLMPNLTIYLLLLIVFCQSHSHLKSILYHYVSRLPCFKNTIKKYPNLYYLSLGLSLFSILQARIVFLCKNNTNKPI